MYNGHPTQVRVRCYYCDAITTIGQPLGHHRSTIVSYAQDVDTPASLSMPRAVTVFVLEQKWWNHHIRDVSMRILPPVRLHLSLMCDAVYRRLDVVT